MVDILELAVRIYSIYIWKSLKYDSAYASQGEGTDCVFLVVMVVLPVA